MKIRLWKSLLLLPMLAAGILIFIPTHATETGGAVPFDDFPAIISGDGVFLPQDPDAEEPPFAPGQLVLRLKAPLAGGAARVDPANTGDPAIDMVNGMYGVAAIERIGGGTPGGEDGLFFYKFSMPEAAPVKQAAADYSKSDLVMYAEPDYLVAADIVEPNDPYWSSSGSWGQSYEDLWGLKKINAASAWEVSTGSSSVVVGVVDTGLDFTHPDIQGNIWNNPGETGTDSLGRDKKTNSVDDDSNGYTDDWRGWDFFNDDNDPTDDHGHGTHVSGTIAGAGNNGAGITGVVWQGRIMPVKFLSSFGSGYISDAVSAVLYGANNGAVVMNHSWGGGGWTQSLADAFAYAHDVKGSTQVAAAGNSNGDASAHQPAAFPTVITVASSTHTDTKSDFSNYGSKIDVAAPGGDSADSTSSTTRQYQNILSLRAAGTTMGQPVGSQYTRARGTSMASPHVAGLAALILSQHPTWTNEQVRQVIRSSADDIGTPGRDSYFGSGRINADRAIRSGTPPVAILTGPTGRVSGSINITGSASGAGFQSYKLEYGAGQAPESWTEITTSTSPVENGNLLAGLDTSSIRDGTVTLRLTVTGSEGTAQDTLTFTLDNIYLTAPSANSLMRTPGVITVSGRAAGTGFESFQVEFGEGMNPSNWSSSGMTLTGSGTAPVEAGTLAAWDTSSLNQAGDYTLKFTVNIGGRQETVTVTIYLDPSLHEGWPRTVSSGTTLAMMDAPTVADLDGDGASETLIAHKDKVYVLRADGSDYPGWPKTVPYVSSLQRSPAVANLDGDSALEIVLGASGYVYAWNGDGTNVNGWPVWAPGSPIAVVADIEDDGTSEVVSVATYYTWDGIKVFNADGSLRSGWPQATPTTWQTPPAVGDISGDGAKEIVFSGYGGKTYAYTAGGAPVSGWPVMTHNYYPYSYPSLADLNNDGKNEVVVGSDQRKVHVLKGDGTALSGWPRTTAGPVMSTPAIGDIDGDGEPEVVAGTKKYGYDSTSRKLYAWNADGTLLPGWPVTAAYSSWTFYGYGSPAIADIDGDDAPEIVVDNDTKYLNAYEADGSIAAGFPKYTGSIGAFASNTPAIGDFDNDGKVEAVAVNYEFKAFMWDLDGRATTANDWPGFRHDPAHTGAYSLPGTGEVADSQSSVTAGASRVDPGGTAQITVELKDRYGAPVAGKTVTLGASGGEATLTQPGSATNAQGQATGAVSAAGGLVTVTATVDALTLTDTAAVAFSDDTESPTVAVTAPSGGETWAGGSVHEVTWTASDNIAMGTAPITLDYSLDGGASWQRIAGGEANDGTYTWTLPAANSDQALVKVTATDISSNTGSAVTEAVFKIDSQAPAVQSHTPAANAIHVPADSTVTVTFSEPVDPATVNSQTLTLSQSGAGQPLAATVNYDPENRTATLTPTASLDTGKIYTVNAGSGVTDFAGHGLTPKQWSFTTQWASNRAYYFTWYDSQPYRGSYSWIVVHNQGSQTASVAISIGGVLKGTYDVAPGAVITPQFPGVVAGPVEVASTNDQPLLVSQRAVYNGSFNEIFAMPHSRLDTTYHFTWYDSKSANGMNGNWILVTNMGATDATAEIYIAGNLKGTYTIPPGGKVTPQFHDTIGGPIKVVSTNSQPLLVSQRVLYRGSFNEVMGVPGSVIDSNYYFTWYDSKPANSMFGNWILAANLGSSPAEIEVYIGGQLKGTFTIPVGGKVTPQFADTANGPVQVKSTNSQPLVVSQRVLFKNSFEEIQGTPPSNLGTQYYFTWYDSHLANGFRGNWILTGNHGSATAAVSQYVAGRKMDDSFHNSQPWQVPVGGRAITLFPGVTGGPLLVEGLNGQPMLVSQRVIYRDSFNELVGQMPEAQ